jgi:hypothetical protein
MHTQGWGAVSLGCVVWYALQQLWRMAGVSVADLSCLGKLEWMFDWQLGVRS